MLMKPSHIVCLLVMALICAGTVSAEDAAIKQRPKFQSRLALAVTPIAGNQGGILKTAEARYVKTFKHAAYGNATFDTYYYSNDVGGIVVRDQPTEPSQTLKLDYLTFELDESKKPAVVHIKIGAKGEQSEFSVEASLIAVAARMAADDQLVLLTMAVGRGTSRSLTSEEMLAVHPAIARHRLSIAAAIIDDSLGSASDFNAAYWLLSENAWPLSAKSFNNSEQHFTLECRGRQTKIEIPNLTTKWKQHLSPKQLAALKQLNDFVAVYRLVNAAAEGHLEGFPEDEFIGLLERIQPHYEAQAVTADEERQFQLWLSQR